MCFISSFFFQNQEKLLQQKKILDLNHTVIISLGCKFFHAAWEGYELIIWSSNQAAIQRRKDFSKKFYLTCITKKYLMLQH